MLKLHRVIDVALGQKLAVTIVLHVIREIVIRAVILCLNDLVLQIVHVSILVPVMVQISFITKQVPTP